MSLQSILLSKSHTLEQKVEVLLNAAKQELELTADCGPLPLKIAIKGKNERLVQIFSQRAKPEQLRQLVATVCRHGDARIMALLLRNSSFAASEKPEVYYQKICTHNPTNLNMIELLACDPRFELDDPVIQEIFDRHLSKKIVCGDFGDLEKLVKYERFQKTKEHQDVFTSILIQSYMFASEESFVFLNQFIREQGKAFKFSHGGLRKQVVHLLREFPKKLSAENRSFFFKSIIETTTLQTIYVEASVLIGLIGNGVEATVISDKEWAAFVKAFLKSIVSKKLSWEEEATIRSLARMQNKDVRELLLKDKRIKSVPSIKEILKNKRHLCKT